MEEIDLDAENDATRPPTTYHQLDDEQKEEVVGVMDPLTIMSK